MKTRARIHTEAGPGTGLGLLRSPHARAGLVALSRIVPSLLLC